MLCWYTVWLYTVRFKTVGWTATLFQLWQLAYVGHLVSALWNVNRKFMCYFYILTFWNSLEYNDGFVTWEYTVQCSFIYHQLLYMRLNKSHAMNHWVQCLWKTHLSPSNPSRCSLVYFLVYSNRCKYIPCVIKYYFYS